MTNKTKDKEEAPSSNPAIQLLYVKSKDLIQEIKNWREQVAHIETGLAEAKMYLEKNEKALAQVTQAAQLLREAEAKKIAEQQQQ